MWMYIVAGVVVLVLAVGVLFVLGMKKAAATTYFHLTADGRIFMVRGTGAQDWIELAAFEAELARLRDDPRAMILYTRERPHEDPAPEVRALFEKLVETNVPIRVLEQPHPAAVRSSGSADGPARQWVGPDGFVNCLLVVLGDGPTKSIVVDEAQSIPDLAGLAGSDEALRAWIEAQGFELNPPATADVIDVLRTSARIKGSRHEGSITAMHVQDDGAAIERAFRVEVDPGPPVRATVSLDG